ncbi:MAG TPA: glycosyltransferase family A protein [Pyrinomonadaceae bacterium]|nr:glycosyltransferase family A protein [Pyrinomonadaceae bacterium]
MSPDLFFSVIIPTYNRAHLIEETLQSVLEQTYPHYEVIIIDNCSTDNTEEVLRPYVESGRVQFVRHDRNYERARSRNTGMSLAKGDFVTFLDSDDLMYATNLEDAAGYAAAHPEIKCFQNLYEFIDADTRKVVYKNRLPSLKNQLKAISEGNFMSCIGDFIHREIYQSYRFDTDPVVTGAEDWDFWLRVLADYSVGRIEKVNNGIIQHSGRSVNNQNLQSICTGLERVVSKLHNDPHLSEIYRPYLKRIEATSFLYIAILANTGRMYREALGFLREAARKDLSILTKPRFARVFQIALMGFWGRQRPLTGAR